jgi:hypothetical protein
MGGGLTSVGAKCTFETRALLFDEQAEAVLAFQNPL